jgi:hypothetical protein
MTNQNPNNLSRISEWKITQRNQSIAPDFGGFFNYQLVDYVDLSGNQTSLKMAVPTYMGKASWSRAPTTRAAYSRRVTPNYFKFRYAIKDLAKGKGFIVGPNSEAVAALHHTQPFIFDPEVSYTLDRNVCNKDRNFIDNLLRCKMAE